MNIEFIDKTTVLIKESLDWSPLRPENKIVISSNEIINNFLNKNKNLEIVSVSGPPRICNFRQESESIGEWTLKVRNKNSKKASKPKAPQQKSKLAPKTTNNVQKKKEE